MLYEKVWEASPNGLNDTENGWGYHLDYIIKTFLETRGWTVDLRAGGPSNLADPEPPSNYTVDRRYWMKRTNTCVDGSTYDVSFVLEIEPSGQDTEFYAWDGVKVTQDSSDPDYGLGNRVFFDNGWSPLYNTNLAWQLWADKDSDGWFFTVGGYYCGGWFPDGGWVRNDFEYADSATPYLNYHAMPQIIVDRDDSSGWGWGTSGSRYSVRNSLGIEYPNLRNLTDFVQINAGDFAMWRDLSGGMLTAGSYRAVQLNQPCKSTYIGPPEARQWYIDIGAFSDYWSFLFPVDGDPGI